MIDLETTGLAPSALARCLTEEVWGQTPVRKRVSGKETVAKAIQAALNRGGEPVDIALAVKTYYLDPDNAREGHQYAMALHRVIEQDRWKEWLPADQTDNGEDSSPARREIERRQGAKT